MIEKGADIDCEDNEGHRVIEYAINCRSKNKCELLIDYGAIVTKDNIEMIAKNGWFDLCKKVIRKKAFERRKHLLTSYDLYY